MMTSSAADRSGQLQGWEHFSHDADIGVRGWGETIAQAFEQAALALTAVVTDAEVRPEIAVSVVCEAPEVDLLLVEWLNTIIYEMSVRHMLFGRFMMTLDNTRLSSTMWGERVDRERHAPACEPKGATFTELRVGKINGLWSAACVVDV